MTDLINAIKNTTLAYPETKDRVLIVSRSAYKAAEIAVSINEKGFEKKGNDIYFLNAKIVVYNYES